MASSQHSRIQNLEEARQRENARQETLAKVKAKILERQLLRQEYFDLEWKKFVYTGKTAVSTTETILHRSQEHYYCRGTGLPKKCFSLPDLFWKLSSPDNEEGVALRCVNGSSTPTLTLEQEDDDDIQTAAAGYEKLLSLRERSKIVNSSEGCTHGRHVNFKTTKCDSSGMPIYCNSMAHIYGAVVGPYSGYLY